MKTFKTLIIGCGLLLPAILLSGNATAQNNNSTKNEMKLPIGKRLEMGIKAGFNCSSNEGCAKLKTLFPYPAFGPAAGTSMDFLLNNYFGVQAELLYSQNVFFDRMNLDVPYSFTNRLSYINLPVMLQIKPYENLSVLFGPQYSLLLGNTYTYAQSSVSESVQQKCENSNVHHNIVSFTCGIDYRVYNVTVGGRLTSMPNNCSINQKDVMIGQLTVAYTFKFGQSYSGGL
jgi:Outer membrane protein beta-barrel domain